MVKSKVAPEGLDEWLPVSNWANRVLLSGRIVLFFTVAVCCGRAIDAAVVGVCKSGPDLIRLRFRSVTPVLGAEPNCSLKSRAGLLLLLLLDVFPFPRLLVDGTSVDRDDPTGEITELEPTTADPLRERLRGFPLMEKKYFKSENFKLLILKEYILWARQILADLSVAAERTQIVEKDRKKPLESNRMPVLKEAVRVPPN